MRPFKRTFFSVIAATLAVGCAQVGSAADPGTLAGQVSAVERAFARTMADRDLAAFTTFLSEEAVFFSGETPARGKDAVAAAWKPFFAAEVAPFSWEPDQVEVLESGSLALSTGPVYDAAGRVIGRFNSIWRREESGDWRVVFDKGSPVCPELSAETP